MINKMNQINTQYDIFYRNRPFLPYFFIKNNSHPRSKKNNFDTSGFFQKFVENNIFDINAIDVSPIEKEEQSNFFNDNSVAENFGFLGNDSNEPPKKKRIRTRHRILHLKMKNPESYYSDYLFLIESPKYNYYFLYHDIDMNIYIQIQYQLPKELNPSKKQNFEMLPPINDYNFLKNLIDNHQLDDFDINEEKEGINFGRGRMGGKGAKMTLKLLKEERDKKKYSG